MIRIFNSIEDIPKYDPDVEDKLWSAITSEGLAEAAIVNIFSQVTDIDVGDLTDAQCRSRLAKIQAQYNFIFFRSAIESSIKAKPIVTHEDIDPEFDYE